MKYDTDERDYYILDRQGEIEKEVLVEILALAELTVPDQFAGEIDPYQFADLIERNLDRIEKEKIPPFVVGHPGGLLDYKQWGHLRLKELPEEFFE
jgi:hypothetical protein